jgi:transposase
LLLVWQEYQAITPDGLQYSQFCQAYRQWAGTLALVMRQSHQVGETRFVDSAGQTMPVVHALTGEVREAASCIAVVGASHSTFAAATWSQRLPDWIGSHVRALTALGGGPQGVVPDHLQAAVSRAQRSEPALNRPDADLAQPSGGAVVPARAAHPREKAQVEVGAQVVERWMLARLRHHTFCSLLELHTAIADLLVALHQRPCKKRPGSRQRFFASLDRPALRPLPAQPSAYAEWQRGRVNIDYHVAVEGHYASVPSSLVKQQLEGRRSAPGVAIFHQGKRMASQQRSPLQGHHNTVAAHLPKAHQHYAEWTPQRLMLWAAQTGEATAQVVETILASRPPPPQGFRACLGLMRLGQRYGAGRLEAACRRAIRIGACSSKSLASIRTHELDPQPLPGPPAAAPLMTQSHIRGAQYSHPNQGDPRMLPHPTRDTLRALQLTGMANALSEQMDLPESQACSCEKRLGLLVEREMTVRSDRRLTPRLRQAKLRRSASLAALT